jgi:WD40 repeat protein
MRSRVAFVAFVALLPSAAPAQSPRADLHGDPLPPGAVTRLGTTRFQCPSAIMAVAFSPDSKSLLVTTLEAAVSTLLVWDAATGKEVARLAPGGSVNDAALTPDGKHVLVAGLEHIRLFALPDGKLLRTFATDGVPGTFAVSPDGTLLVAQPRGKAANVPIRVWELDTGRELVSFPGRGNGAFGLRFSGDGKRLLSWSTVIDPDRSVAVLCVWDVPSRKLVRAMKIVDRFAILLAPDGETAAWMDEQSSISIVNVATGKKVTGIDPGTEPLAFTPDARALFTATGSDAPVLWDVATGKQIRTLAGLAGRAYRRGTLSPDGRTLAVVVGGMRFGVVLLVDAQTGKVLNPDHGHSAAVTCAAFDPTGKVVASGGDDHSVRLWDAADGKPLQRLGGHKAPVLALAFGPGGKLLASSSADGSTRLWDAVGGKLLAELHGPAGGATVLAFSADGRTLTAGGAEGEIRAWTLADIAGKPPLARVLETGPLGRVLALDPCHGLAITAHARMESDIHTDRLKLWSTATGRAVREIPFAKRAVWAARLSPDSRILAWAQSRAERTKHGTYYEDDAVHLLERASGQPIRVLDGAAARTLAFAPEGRLLAAGCGNRGSRMRPARAVYLWDVLTGEQKAVFEGHAHLVSCVAFSPDGMHLLSASADHTLLVWEVPAVAPPRAGQLPPLQLDRWWDELTADAAVAYPALAGFVELPQAAVPWLAKRLPPAPAVDSNHIAALVAALDSPTFKERQQAQRALQELGEFAEPALRQALDNSPPLELRRRAEQLLAKIEATPPTPEQLRLHRAVAALEWIGNDDARAVLEKLARGAAEARLTREAAAALERLNRRKGL